MTPYYSDPFDEIKARMANTRAEYPGLRTEQVRWLIAEIEALRAVSAVKSGVIRKQAFELAGGVTLKGAHKSVCRYSGLSFKDAPSNLDDCVCAAVYPKKESPQ